MGFALYPTRTDQDCIPTGLAFRLSLDEATEHGGLAINDVGKSYYLLKKANIYGDERRQLLLQINCQLDRFEQLYNIIQSFASEDTDMAHQSMVPEMAKQFYQGDNDWSDDSCWYDDDLTWGYGDSQEYWNDSAWEDDDTWYADDDWSSQ